MMGNKNSKNKTSHIGRILCILIRVVYKHLDSQSAAFALRAHAGQNMDAEIFLTFST